MTGAVIVLDVTEQPPQPPPTGSQQVGSQQTGAPQPRAPRWRRPVIAAGAVVLVTVVCGVVSVIANRDPLVNRGQPVVAPQLAGTPTPTWTPGNMFTDPHPIDEIRFDLESRVLQAAAVARPVTSTCDAAGFTGEDAASFQCTVTYANLRIVYDVSATPSGQYTFKYKAEASQAIVTRDAILSRFTRQYRDFTNLRCDPLPEMALVPTNKPLDQLCYGKLKGHKTAKVQIFGGDTGPRFNTVF